VDSAYWRRCYDSAALNADTGLFNMVNWVFVILRITDSAGGLELMLELNQSCVRE
jgi:hypothetical protein